MTREEAIKELQEEWEIFLEGIGLKYKTEEEFQKEVDDNPDLKKIVEAHYAAIKALEQEPSEDEIILTKGEITYERIQIVYMDLIVDALCTIADILEGKNDGSN